MTRDVAIRQVFDWFNANDGSDRPFAGLPIVAGVNTLIGGSLSSPNAIEYAAGVSRLLGERGNRFEPICHDPGYANPVTSVEYYFFDRDAYRTETQYRTDLSVDYQHRVGGREDVFFHAEVLNVFNQFQLCGCGSTVFNHGGGTMCGRSTMAFDGSEFRDDASHSTRSRRRRCKKSTGLQR